MKVKVVQGELKGNIFFVYCKCFCDIFVTQMVCFRLKDILVLFSLGAGGGGRQIITEALQIPRELEQSKLLHCRGCRTQKW